jgi:hypothetical protein
VDGNGRSRIALNVDVNAWAIVNDNVFEAGAAEFDHDGVDHVGHRYPAEGQGAPAAAGLEENGHDAIVSVVDEDAVEGHIRAEGIIVASADPDEINVQAGFGAINRANVQVVKQDALVAGDLALTRGLSGEPVLTMMALLFSK